MKRLTIAWAKEKSQREDHILSQIEFKLKYLLGDSNKGFTSMQDKLHLIELDRKKERILKE